MYNQLINYLNRPFPVLETSREKLGISAYFGFFIFIFLLIFQPFGISDTPDTVLWVTLGYGVITFLVVAAIVFGAGVIMPGFFNPDEWAVKHHLLLSVANLVVISAANWAYAKYFAIDGEHHYSLLSFLFITLVVGIFPVLFSIYYYENKFARENSLLADETTNIINSNKLNDENKQYNFTSSTKNEKISIPIADLICIKAEGNYCNFFFIEKDKFSRKLLRISLKSTEDELQKEPKIIKCHRSWLINLDKVQSVKGTARSLTVSMNMMPFNIPVSRNFANSVTNALRHR